MSSVIQHFIHAHDLMPEHGRRLIEWCAEQGGDEFSLQFMRLDGAPSDVHAQLIHALVPFHCGALKRTKVTTMVGQPSPRPTEIWHLTSESIAVLPPHILDDVFEKPSYSRAGWLEDFTVYRRGAIMLGIISHEGVAIVNLTDSEHQDLLKLGIKSSATAA